MRKILIIDDDDAMRQILRIRLESAYTVIDTGDPQTAFATALEHKPDAILLDLSMKKLSGFELCQTFTSCSMTRNIPIFIVTGGDLRNSAYCKELGATGFFQKPIDFSRLSGWSQ
jgi:DNA-binding response OmpR family regulator